jgi:signal transduction histidine kinase
MLILVYFKKNRKNMLINKVYGAMLITGFIGLLSEITCHFVYNNINSGDLFAVAAIKAYYISLLVIVALFDLYVYLVGNDKNKISSRSLVISSAVIAIISIVIIFLPVQATINGESYYVDGPSLDALLLAVTISLAYWIYKMAFMIFHHKMNKRMRPVLFVSIVFIVIAIIQMMDKSILITDSCLGLVLLYLYMTIENPDAKMAELATRAKNIAEKADKVKSDFLSIASHQLRTPLTSIRGNSSMLLDGDFGNMSKEQEHALTEIANSSDRMVYLIEDLLNVSRLQSGKFAINRTAVDLGELVRAEIEQVSSIADSHNVKIIYDDKKWKGMELVNLDKGKIGEVVSNMIDNAIFYSPAGSTVKVSLVQAEGFMELRIKDQGIGVPESERDDLFTKFYRASNARTKRPDGTGIGLFLAKKIIHGHGGKIIFESKEGVGSTFGFRLPIT